MEETLQSEPTFLNQDEVQQEMSAEQQEEQSRKDEEFARLLMAQFEQEDSAYQQNNYQQDYDNQSNVGVGSAGGVSSQQQLGFVPHYNEMPGEYQSNYGFEEEKDHTGAAEAPYEDSEYQG